MNTWRHSRRALLSLLAVAVLTACGGGGEAATTTVDEPDTTETTAPETTEPDQQEGSDDGDGVSGLTSVCLEASQAMAAAVTSYSTGIAGAMGGTLDDDELEEVAGQLQAMADAAPDEIKADLEVIATEIEAFYTAWADIGFTGAATPTPEQIQQIEALGDVIDQEAFDEAAANLEAWFEANC